MSSGLAPGQLRAGRSLLMQTECSPGAPVQAGSLWDLCFLGVEVSTAAQDTPRRHSRPGSPARGIPQASWDSKSALSGTGPPRSWGSTQAASFMHRQRASAHLPCVPSTGPGRGVQSSTLSLSAPPAVPQPGHPHLLSGKPWGCALGTCSGVGTGQDSHLCSRTGTQA